MKRHLSAAILALLLFSFPAVAGQVRMRATMQEPTIHGDVITVSRAGTAFAKPDLGILTMAIRSSEPLVEEATSDNVNKAKAVETALAGLGYSPDQYKITSVAFGQDGAGMQYVQPNRAAPMGYEVSQYIYVYFAGPELGDVTQLGEKEAAVIEALRKAGAVPASPSPAGRIYPSQSQAAMVVYTIKDSDRYEREALQQALQRAREAAHDVARTMQVHIVRLDSVRTGFLARAYPMRNGLAPLEGLPYRFYSPTSDEVQISANATLNYIFK